MRQGLKLEGGAVSTATIFSSNTGGGALSLGLTIVSSSSRSSLPVVLAGSLSPVVTMILLVARLGVSGTVSATAEATTGDSSAASVNAWVSWLADW